MTPCHEVSQPHQAQKIKKLLAAYLAGKTQLDIGLDDGLSNAASIVNKGLSRSGTGW